jgi:anti-sigma factor RsiW
MKPIEPTELSGYLDGELAPDRLREVEAALARDSSLRADYEVLANADRAWKSIARSAEFVPRTQLRSARSLTNSRFAIATVLVLLVVLRMMPKVIDVVAWGIVLHAAALVLLLQWVVRMARESQNQT